MKFGFFLDDVLTVEQMSLQSPEQIGIWQLISL
jgi:hypothetical protein